MQHEYGVSPSDVEWVLSAEDSSAAVSGQVSEFESVLPDGLSVSTGSEGKDESEVYTYSTETGEAEAAGPARKKKRPKRRPKPELIKRRLHPTDPEPGTEESADDESQETEPADVVDTEDAEAAAEADTPAEVTALEAGDTSADDDAPDDGETSADSEKAQAEGGSP